MKPNLSNISKDIVSPSANTFTVTISMLMSNVNDRGIPIDIFICVPLICLFDVNHRFDEQIQFDHCDFTFGTTASEMGLFFILV